MSGDLTCGFAVSEETRQADVGGFPKKASLVYWAFLVMKAQKNWEVPMRPGFIGLLQTRNRSPLVKIGRGRPRRGQHGQRRCSCTALGRCVCFCGLSGLRFLGRLLPPHHLSEGKHLHATIAAIERRRRGDWPRRWRTCHCRCCHLDLLHCRRPPPYRCSRHLFSLHDFSER